ncbi:PAX-interacting protein 1-like [Branchiostoma floridae x Branchiostoma japonicum]
MVSESQGSEDLTVPGDFFKEVKYFLCGNISDQVQKLLRQGGGKEYSYLTDLATHVIADNEDYPEVSEAREVYDLPAVTPKWVTLSARCGRLLPHKAFTPEDNKLFSGLVLCLSQIPEEDRKALWGMVTFYGGNCQLNFNKRCTHLVTPKPEGAKYECALKHTKIKVVTPDWIVDSLAQKKQQEEEKYHPRLVIKEEKKEPPPANQEEEEPMDTLPSSANQGEAILGLDQSGLSLDGKKKLEAPRLLNLLNKSSCDQTPPDHRSLGRVQSPLLTNRRIRDITNSGHIDASGTKLVLSPRDSTKVHETIQISQLDDTPPYLKGDGELLEYHGHDPKINVPPDTCLLGCIFVIVDYQEQVLPAQLETWTRVVHQHGGFVDPGYSQRCTHLLCDNQASPFFKQAQQDGKRCVTAYWLNDVLTIKKMIPPWKALHLPTPFPHSIKPCNGQIIAVTGFVDQDRENLKMMISLAGAKYTGSFSRFNTVLICKRPEGEKHKKALEWRTPCLNVQWLSDIILGNFDAIKQMGLPKYQNFSASEPFQLDYHYVKAVMGPWTTALQLSQDALQNLSRNRVLFTPSPPKSKRKGSQDGNGTNKRQRNEPIKPYRRLPPEKTPRVLFTGLDIASVNDLTTKVQLIGGEVAESIHKCTHLVSTKVLRTVKFLSGVSSCRFIVSPAWVEDSFKRRCFVEEKMHTLVDQEQEAQFGFRLAESLARARVQKLFKDTCFYMTPNVIPRLDMMKTIVESAGGKVIGTKPAVNRVLASQQRQGSPRIFIITCESDVQMCADYASNNIDVYSAEFILTGVLCQKMDFDSFRF